MKFRMSGLLAIAAFALAGPYLVLGMLAETARAQTIITFDPTGSVSTNVFSINDAGAITGYYADASGVNHGFLRAVDGTIIPFDAIVGSISTEAFSINVAGAITGSYYVSGVNHGFLRAANGKIASFDPAGSISTLPLSINAEGAITGQYQDAKNAYHGFLRAASGTIISFDAIKGSINTLPNSINARGAITG
jgi:hypothetical protein